LRGIRPIRFENESDGRFDSRFDSNEKTIRMSLICNYVSVMYRFRDISAVYEL